MAKRYTVLFIDDKGNPVRESLVSKRSIRMLASLAVILIGLCVTGAYRFVHMQNELAGKNDLIAEIEQQKNEIEGQRIQLQSFAHEINDLKASLVTLNSFESKIRIMANLEHRPDKASLFAMGGSMPEDLDADLPLSQDHDRLVRAMHDQIEHVQQASSAQGTSFKALIKSLESKRNLLASTPSIRPANGWYSSQFGYRISPFTGRKAMHKGLDIANTEGTKIIAPADGVVTFAGKKWLIGNVVQIDHGHGITTRFGHASQLLIHKGDRVKRGDVIALMGNTGRSTGPHLHYEVRLNGVPVNPLKYILD
jgi:murein DD-endopeptidase MepM/ murein hydrolase activator NlpD